MRRTRDMVTLIGAGALHVGMAYMLLRMPAQKMPGPQVVELGVEVDRTFPDAQLRRSPVNGSLSEASRLTYGELCDLAGCSAVRRAAVRARDGKRVLRSPLRGRGV